jgi:hypothetical protein
MNELTKYLVEGILAEEETGITVLLPGGFKPPHGGHLELAKRYASQPNVTKVEILIGPKERDGITRDQSMQVWKALLIGTTNIIVKSVAEDNPLLAAYKYIETAKPGNYALAASSKGEDYERVKKFVQSHAQGSKYHRDGVNVVELPLNTQPLLYKGRTDGLDGKGVSASVMRKDLASKNYRNFETNYPASVPESTLRTIYMILTKQRVTESSLLNEGGAAGHLAHPFEDFDLTFKDIKGIVDSALSGTIEYAQEKLDGQNLMVTYKDGQVRAARNKGQVKDFAANSLTVKQVEDTFAGRGPIQTAFAEAMKDLETAINRLSPKQKEKFFGNGSKFVNLEVLFPQTANVIPYGASQLRLHNITAYDQAGNVTGTDQESARQLSGAIRQIEAENQKTYDIRITDPLTIQKSADYKNQKTELLKLLSDTMSKYGLKDGDKLGLYYQAWWKEYISNTAKQYNYQIPENTLQQLVNRWAFSNKEVNIKTIRDGIANEDFKNWVIEFDKKDYATQRKIAAKPIENLFLKLGVYTLKNVQNLVALNPNQSIRQIKKDLQTAIQQIKDVIASPSTQDDGAALEFLKRELGRLKDIGGFKAIVPTEGLVFKHNGKLYKLTGAFAPINQILGYLRF